MPKREALEPLFIHIPSVRPLISESLSKWFVHAVEANAGGENAGAVARRLSSLAQDLKLSTENRRLLSRIAERLKACNLFGEASGREIHFVVADNSAYYQGKPVQETHTPRALELARALNAVGNPYGVFIHYLTPDEFGELKPRALPEANDHPLFHLDEAGNVKVGPGAASNIALSYIKALRGKGTAFVLRMNDDFFPSMGPFAWRGEKKTHRNFFSDFFAGRQGALSRVSYRGYFDSTGERGNQARVSDFTALHTDLDYLRYYATHSNEDIGYAPGKSISVPDYLIHAGRKSTWVHLDERNVFGKYPGNGIVSAAPESFVQAVLKRSGIKTVR